MQGTKKDSQNKKLRNRIIFLGVKVALSVFVLCIIFGSLFGIQRVSGVGMDKRVKDGDLILYSRRVAEYTTEDVVIFEDEGQVYISAILAMGGDLVDIDEKGHLLVNGQQALEDVVFNIEQGEEPKMNFPIRISDSYYFVLNENLDDQNDSRSFGAIKQKQLKGKVIGLLRARSV